ncbi:uncharacterized protein LOC122504624 [Leptopilina heterotoma]|uniref:uncharacterized protein LOC122504624 n=1 Tax=Leptopilina heterotoma TaxID=63436 RepID=UPI001CA8D9B9|nr:uncharacterized protein LOC122504624 [Leptopilina heterotoma]
MEVKSSEETRDLKGRILITENDKMPELCSISNYSSYSKRGMGKNLSLTVSNPTTCADKKSIITEKSKEKFQAIPLHLTQGNVRFILSKEPLQKIQVNPKIHETTSLDYDSYQVFTEVLKKYVILCKNAVILWFSMMTFSLFYNRNIEK